MHYSSYADFYRIFGPDHYTSGSAMYIPKRSMVIKNKRRRKRLH